MNLKAEEYERVVGQHVLISLIDPTGPIYECYSEEERRRAFHWRSLAFRICFANQEFDRWYLDIVEQIRQMPWAYHIWEHPPGDLPSFVLAQETNLVHPAVGELRFYGQMNQLARLPRFRLIQFTPRDIETWHRVELLTAMPEFEYSERFLSVP